jgi:acyl-CoA synthetase (AMP-forming)/AMP-acid ligase II
MPNFIHDLVDAAGAHAPGGVAVRDGEQSWTYAQLSGYSRRCATWLRACGVTSGDRVVISAAADRRIAGAIFACSRIGATFVPIAPDLTPAAREQIVRDAQPRLVLTGADALPDLDAWAGGAPSVDEVLADHRHPAMLIYTSGSTATPKGVVCPHAQIVFVVDTILERLRYRSDDVILCRLPLSFDYGLYQVFLSAVATAEVVLAGPGQDLGLLALARRTGVTVVPVVPSLASQLLRLASRDRRPTRIRLFTNTGEELPSSTIEALRTRFPLAGIQLMFGITECKRVSIMEVDGDLRRPGSVGRPLNGTTVRVVDTLHRRVAPGTVGEIVVAGPHVMAGYWRAPELTGAMFRPDPKTGAVQLYTGDHGFLDEDGYLYFVGRRDDIFKRNGVRTSAIEIEAAAREVPGVADAAVVPPVVGTELVVYVVGAVTPIEVLRGLRDRLDAAKVPSVCRVVRSIPRGATGKIDRAALAGALSSSHAAPRTPLTDAGPSHLRRNHVR